MYLKCFHIFKIYATHWKGQWEFDSVCKRAQYLYDVVLTRDLNSLLAVVQRSEDRVTSPGDE